MLLIKADIPKVAKHTHQHISLTYSNMKGSITVCYINVYGKINVRIRYIKVYIETFAMLLRILLLDDSILNELGIYMKYVKNMKNDVSRKLLHGINDSNSHGRWDVKHNQPTLIFLVSLCVFVRAHTLAHTFVQY